MALGVRLPLAEAAAAHALHSPILTPDATREDEETSQGGVDVVDEPESPEVGLDICSTGFFLAYRTLRYHLGLSDQVIPAFDVSFDPDPFAETRHRAQARHRPQTELRVPAAAVSERGDPRPAAGAGRRRRHGRRR